LIFVIVFVLFQSEKKVDFSYFLPQNFDNFMPVIYQAFYQNFHQIFLPFYIAFFLIFFSYLGKKQIRIR